MKFFVTVFIVCLALALASAQQYFPIRAPRQFNFNGFDFGSQAGNVRDPRDNRGPVVFPPSPPDAVDESSGVIVGASGYGFVPPSQRTVFG